MNLKGSLPLLILHILLDGPYHGYHIAKHIKEQSKGVLDFKEGTLYPTLHGMEKKGLIEANTEKEKGRKRRYYRLTDKGRQAFDGELAEWQDYARAVNRVLGGVTTS